MATTNPGIVVGVSGFVYSLLTDGTDISGGTATYGTVYPITGLKSANYKAAGSLSRFYGDNGVFASSETTGDQSISIDLADLPPQDRARILGHSYANGQIVQASTDVSPYVAVGFKLSLDGANGYVWFTKVKFSKPDQGATTKESSVNYQSQMIEGAVVNLICNSAYRTTIRTDDASAPAATLTGWFTNPVISNNVDTTALTVVITAGAGATKTMLATFSKASASGSIPFTIPTASITAIASALQAAKVSDGSTAGPLSAVILSAGTGFSNSTVTVTITTNVAATAVYNLIAAGSAIKDASGVSVTAYFSGSVTTRT